MGSVVGALVGGIASRIGGGSRKPEEMKVDRTTHEKAAKGAEYSRIGREGTQAASEAMQRSSNIDRIKIKRGLANATLEQNTGKAMNQLPGLGGGTKAYNAYLELGRDADTSKGRVMGAATSEGAQYNNQLLTNAAGFGVNLAGQSAKAEIAKSNTDMQEALAAHQDRLDDWANRRDMGTAALGGLYSAYGDKLQKARDAGLKDKSIAEGTAPSAWERAFGVT